ncbi:MAG TPA: hypothetical protein VGF69_01600 [Thermoanaerobaculia bacterium]|jgi:Zn-dependent M16 (insulinase) family peptidase
MRPLALAVIIMCAVSLSLSAAPPADVNLGKLTKGQLVNGFDVSSIYVDAADKPIGGRFVHRRSGFTLDLLQIESAPQGFTWVNSFPVGDQGEPHTQEHLLLGKGTTGRSFAALDTMWLSGSSAFTMQWRTIYHFNTSAGADTFFDLLGAELNALLHPNYSDEEIRREVRHFGTTTNPDGTLRLEEKGSVYNEMTSSSANPFRVLFREAGHLVYGRKHPLSYNSGGEPSGIRTMQPQDIRDFHAANYYLANMGIIAAFPKSVPLHTILERTNGILNKVEPEGKKRQPTTATALPAPQASPAGTISVAEYPHRNDQQPSPVSVIWPANRELSANDVILAELFASTFAGDATSNLYKTFIDSKTRTLDIGATGVFANVDRDQGNPIAIIFQNVNVANLTNEKLAQVRQKVQDELTRIAALPDGSPELKEFNARVSSRLAETERDLANFVNSPPAWGFRNTNSSWMEQLLFLEKTPEFRKSLVLEPQIEFARAQLASEKNVWRDALTRWKLTTTVPYVAAAKPSPALLQREEAERVARANAEAARLAKQYNLAETQTQEALKRYNVEYEAIGAKIEADAKSLTPPAFVKNPPLSIDEDLRYTTAKLESGVPIVTSTFDSMTSATLGLALRADRVPREQLRYLSLLPALLTRVGVIENGKPVSYDEMSERLRNEILNLNAGFTTNPRTERVELIVRGSGLGQQEFERSMQWMNLVLHHPDWRPENLARIRDVVDQSLSNLRNTMQGSEESWVNNPANAYRMQHNAAFLAADSFLTRTHNALRLKWLLREAPAADRETLSSFLTGLSTKAANRADLKAMLAKPESLGTFSDAARPIATELAKDLDLALLEIPDSSLAADWTYLVTALRDDLLTPSSTALANLDAVRRTILRTSGARMFLVTNPTIQKATAGRIASLAASLDKSAAPALPASKTRLVDQRLAARDSSATAPVYVGLLAPNMKGGVIITSVPSVHFADLDREKQLDFLASRLYAAYGAHGVFLKTLAAGLAYSNGLRGSVSSGRIGYYAERTPEIPQTVRYVVNILKTAERDPRLGDYAIAQVFGESRAAATYESRAENMAADIADGQTPEQVRRFRSSILELRKDPELGNKLFERKDAVYGRMLPGYNVKGKDVADAYYFTIGPDKQLDAWETYLRESEGQETKLYRLYPRDFWLP